MNPENWCCDSCVRTYKKPHHKCNIKGKENFLLVNLRVPREIGRRMAEGRQTKDLCIYFVPKLKGVVEITQGVERLASKMYKN